MEIHNIMQSYTYSVNVPDQCNIMINYPKIGIKSDTCSDDGYMYYKLIAVKSLI